MGLFSKLKNIFYDEEIVEEDIDNEEEEEELRKVDKEVRKDKEDGPKVEEIKIIKQEPKIEEIKEVERASFEEEPKERELFRSERVFNFTELDDEEETTLPPKRNILSSESRASRSTERTTNIDITPPEQPKVFKPSPIISPIYGILDKDYKKEEIISKKETVVKEIDSPAKKYDSVRRKAYGTLEDELEDTLNKVSTKDIKAALDKEEDSTLDSRTAKIEDLIDKIDEATDELDKSMSIEEAENNVKIDNFDDEDEAEEELSNKTLADSTLEHDLFNLIDSMYDKEE
jgi:hypothetical protein